MLSNGDEDWPLMNITINRILQAWINKHEILVKGDHLYLNYIFSISSRKRVSASADFSRSRLANPPTIPSSSFPPPYLYLHPYRPTSITTVVFRASS